MGRSFCLLGSVIYIFIAIINYDLNLLSFKGHKVQPAIRDQTSIFAVRAGKPEKTPLDLPSFIAHNLYMPQFKVDFGPRGALYTDEEILTVTNVMRSTDGLTQGRHLKEFEAAFAQYQGSPGNCFALSSAAAALELAATLSGIGPGDEVIIPAHTYCASAIPFARTGAKIVWADIDPDTFNLSPESIKNCLSPKTKVIVAVHLYGLMADMDSIMAIAKDAKCLVVEDAAQALGASINGKKAGTYGDFSVFSFQSQKNITTLGEGGILQVKSDNHAKHVPGIRHNGHTPYPTPREDYWLPAMVNVDQDIPGVWPYNYSICEAQCALGTQLLKRIDAINQKRNARAQEFIQALADSPELSFQKIPQGYKSAYHLLPARYSGDRDHFIRTMANEFKIKTIVQYHPLYRYPLFQKNNLGSANCPNTDAFFDSMVSFPFQDWMPNEEFNYMINSTKELLAKHYV